MVEASHGTSEFGTFIHKILEKYGKGELETYELAQFYEDNYGEYVKSDFTLKLSQDFSKDFGGNYYEKGYSFLSNFNGFDFQILETEKYFDINHKDLFRLNGQIDVIAKQDNNYIIVDYKSKGNWKSKAERLEYEKQLYFYAYAFKQIYGFYPKRMGFYMFRIDKWTWVDFDEKRLNEVLKWMEETVEIIESEFEFTSIIEESNDFNFFCSNFCGFRNQCKYKTT